MSQCSKGNPCGASCISKRHKCRRSLNPGTSSEVERALQEIGTRDIQNVVGQLFGKKTSQKAAEVAPRVIIPPAPKPKDELILDDISRLLKGEEALHIPLTRDNKSRGGGEVTRLQDALRLGDLTRQEVGRDWDVLKAEAERRKEELRKQIKKQQILGTSKAKAKEKELRAELDDINNALKAGQGQKAPVSSFTKDARINAKYFDESFSLQKTVSGEQKDYDWENNARKGTNGKKGAFGSVLFEDEIVVKRGELGEKELEILKKVGAAGLGPILVYGELGKWKEKFASVSIHEGRVAMSRVPGVEINTFPDASHSVNGRAVGDLYWSSRASLHRIGVAHNDSHGGNLLVDKDGTAKFVDFGIAQDNPKAALSEAFGAIVSKQTLPFGAVISGGIKTDVQAAKVKVSGLNLPTGEQPGALRRIYSNLPKVKSLMKTMGLSDDDIAQVMSSGIRNPESIYNKGAWGKLTNAQALKIINSLYDGI